MRDAKADDWFPEGYESRAEWLKDEIEWADDSQIDYDVWADAYEGECTLEEARIAGMRLNRAGLVAEVGEAFVAALESDELGRRTIGDGSAYIRPCYGGRW